MKKGFLTVVMSAVLTGGLLLMPVQAEESGEGSFAGLLSSLFGEGGELDGAFDEGGSLSGIFDEGGIVDELFGEGGELAEYVPEGMDVRETAQDIAQQLGDPDSDLYQGLEGFEAMITDEDGNIDYDMAATLFGGLFGDSTEMSVSADGEDYELGDLFPPEEVMQTIEAHVLARNAEELEEGDVQIVTPYIQSYKTNDDGSKQVFAILTQMNFTQEGTDLTLESGAARYELLTLAADESGAWSVTDCREPEDGEAFADSLNVLLEEAGQTMDSFESSVFLSEMGIQGKLKEYLDTHEDAERIEYAGELLTSEELEAVINSTVDQLLSNWGEEEEMTTE